MRRQTECYLAMTLAYRVRHAKRCHRAEANNSKMPTEQADNFL